MFDHLLRLATDYEAYDWDNWQNTWGSPIGIVLNIFCMISRGQAEKFRRSTAVDDVFQRGTGGVGSSAFIGGLSYLLWLSSWILAAFSIGNAIYCFTRKKSYRLFESNIEIEPATPSARRVRVDSSPTTTPLNVLGRITEPFRFGDASDRVYPDEHKDVWQVEVWDPTPMSLHLFSIFSPVHVAIYFLSLPIASNRVSRSPLIGYESGVNAATVYLTVILTQIILSLQIIFLKSQFIQQTHDHAIINKEVMHEYDAKYVHPRLNVLKRDVAVQCADDRTGERASAQVYTPQSNRAGFKTYANPNYAELTMQSQLPPGSATRSPGLGGFSGHSGFAPASSTPSMPPQRIKGPRFETVRRNRSSSDWGSLSSTAGTQTFQNGNDSLDTTERLRERRRERERERTNGDIDYEPHLTSRLRMGTEGLVDWSRQNSRSLTPSKMTTPLTRGSTIRGSTYAESLGTPLGTPIRRR